MRAVLTAHGSRGDVEPMVALQALGAEARVCAPRDADIARWQRRPRERASAVAAMIRTDGAAEAARELSVVVRGGDA